MRGAGGTAEGLPDYYRAVLAINHAAAIRVPVLLVHGEQDYVAPTENSMAMAEALLAHGNSEVELVLIPGMGHMFEMGVSGYDFDRVIGLARDWLGRTLPTR